MCWMLFYTDRTDRWLGKKVLPSLVTKDQWDQRSMGSFGRWVAIYGTLPRQVNLVSRRLRDITYQHTSIKSIQNSYISYSQRIHIISLGYGFACCSQDKQTAHIRQRKRKKFIDKFDLSLSIQKKKPVKGWVFNISKFPHRCNFWYILHTRHLLDNFTNLVGVMKLRSLRFNNYYVRIETPYYLIFRFNFVLPTSSHFPYYSLLCCKNF